MISASEKKSNGYGDRKPTKSLSRPCEPETIFARVIGVAAQLNVRVRHEVVLFSDLVS